MRLIIIGLNLLATVAFSQSLQNNPLSQSKPSEFNARQIQETIPLTQKEVLLPHKQSIKDLVTASDNPSSSSPPHTPDTPPPPIASPDSQHLSRVEQYIIGQFPSEITKNIRQFGYNLFSGNGERFKPLLNTPVGPDYIVGPKDIITIRIWGKINQEFDVEIDNEGNIFIPKVGLINAAGITVKKLEGVLQEHFAKLFSDFNLAITFKKIRTMTLYLVGEVENPGSYTVSSLTTFFSALFATSGPTKNGSLRNIQLIRHNKVIATLDLYRFLFSGDRSQDQKLMPGDTIKVPPIGPVVGITGHVRKPAIYEFRRPTISLRELINTAQGLTIYGYLSRIQVDRIEDNTRKTIVDYRFKDDELAHYLDSKGRMTEKSKRLNVTLKNGDLVKVFPILDGVENVVYLKGHAHRVGPYAWQEGMVLSDVIRNYQDLKKEPYLDYAYIIRTMLPNRNTKIIPFNLRDFLSGKINPSLHPLDVIHIYSKYDINKRAVVTITGAVSEPGSYILHENMRLTDLLLQAGGVLATTYLEKAEIIRRSPPSFEEQLLSINLRKALSGSPDANIILHPLDTVKLYAKSDFADPHFVYIRGSVKNPGSYPFLKEMRISDLIFQAGGLTQAAFWEQAELTRLHYTQNGTDTEIIDIDLRKVMAQDPNSDHRLQPNDQLFVRKIPDFYYTQTIEISGEVKFPGTYAFKTGERLYDVLTRTGGFSEFAYLAGAVFQRESVKQLQQNRLNKLIRQQEEALLTEITTKGEQISKDQSGIWQKNIEHRKALLEKLKNATTTGRIIIRLTDLSTFKDSPYNILLENQDKLTIPRIPTTVSVLGDVYNANGIIHVPGKRLSYYLKKVGGPTEDADDDNLFLVKADGSVISQKNYGGFFHSFHRVKIDPGDTILVPRDLALRVNYLDYALDITEVMFKLATTAGLIFAIQR